MEKRALLAFILSLMILILYQKWVEYQYGTPPAPLEEAKEKPRPPSVEARPSLQEVKKITAAPATSQVREVRVETDLYVAFFISQGARLKNFTLKRYRASVNDKSPPLEMVLSKPGVPYPLGVQLRGSSPLEDEALVYSVRGGDLRLTGDAKQSLIFETRTSAGITLTKKFTFTGSSYAIGVEVSVGGGGGDSNPGLLLTSAADNSAPSEDAVAEGLLALVGNKIKREPVEELKKGKEFRGPVSWAGFGYTYFLFALLPQGEEEQRVVIGQKGSALVMEVLGQTPGKGTYTLFIGPKDVEVMKTLEKGLERSIDFGYFAFVSVPLLYVMRVSHGFTGSYGIDIILLTVLMKLLTAPLTHKSFVSMKQMQKLQPQMERIKEKFKDDKEKMNKEIMELYRRNKVNPLGGCLPMLLQFPIFIGLYNALLTPIELRHAPFMWIKDLSRPDWESLPFTLGGWKLGIPVLTLLMGASMFLQQWMTPSAGDPNQRRMMLMMPLVFTVMFVTFPAGLTIYWLVNNILSIGQQYLINRMHR